MRLGLGIDTGGTYTDSVIYDFEENKVLARAKDLTTKGNLLEGIKNSMEKLPEHYFKDIILVALSTTLATNACVEGKGSRGKLVLLGYDEDILKKLGKNYGLPDREDMILISGKHGQKGEVVEEPDWDLLQRLVLDHRAKVDAFGVAEYWGVRNPDFEKKAKELIRLWTNLPVVSAHELSGEINSLRRASTTLLNARLISLTKDLLEAVKMCLAEKAIYAPLMIVRGDGTLMSEDFARERPVETLLSGPAASVIGGMKLSGLKDCLVLDIGGTTSDLAVVRDGMVNLAAEGVDVGGWRTGTQAIEIKTIGLGGDSLISFDKHEKITIGPRRAVPLSWLGMKWSQVREELKAIYRENKWHTLSLAEFFVLLSDPSRYPDLSEEEKRIVEVLSESPRSIEKLAEAVHTRPYFLETERLEFLGIIGRAALTPTDIMHITGEFREWDVESAMLGAGILAQRLGLTVDALIETVKANIEKKLFVIIAQHLLKKQWKKPFKEGSKELQTILDMAFEQPFDELGIHITTTLPIVGIGAPTHVFLGGVAKALKTQAVIPEDAGVANAVGAITGSIVGEETVLIKPHYEVTGISGYGCHSSKSYYETGEYEDALAWSKEEAQRGAREQAKAMGADEVEVSLEIDEKSGVVRDAKQGLLLETVIRARAVGQAQRIAARV